MSLADELGFRVEDRQVKTTATRKDMFDNVVPIGVRPATNEEVVMYDMLVKLTDTANSWDLIDQDQN